MPGVGDVASGGKKELRDGLRVALQRAREAHPGLSRRREQQDVLARDRGLVAEHFEQHGLPGAGRPDQHRDARGEQLLQRGDLLDPSQLLVCVVRVGWPAESLIEHLPPLDIALVASPFLTAGYKPLMTCATSRSRSSWNAGSPLGHRRRAIVGPSFSP